MNTTATEAGAQQASDSSSNATAASTLQNTLDTLPNELLQQIWLHLEDPASFALTNKRFLALSQDTLWRAKWFMRSYALYAVFYQAISRPKIFTDALVQQLVHLGAPVSRNLVQLVELVRDPEVLIHLEKRSRETEPLTKWARFINDAALLELYNHAERLYGSEDLFWDPEWCDAFIYSHWSIRAQWGLERLEWPEPSEDVRSAFHDFGFAPLPIGLFPAASSEVRARLIEREDDTVASAVMFDPLLLDSVLANGYLNSVKQTHSILEAVLVRRDPTQTEAPWKEVNKLIATAGGVLEVSAQFAREAIISMACHGEPPSGITLLAQAMGHTGGEANVSYRYDCLVHLDRKSALPFKLQDVIEDVLEPMAQAGSITTNVVSLLDKLDKAFDSWPRITPLFVLNTFLKAERQSVEDVDEVKGMMGRHEVTSASIMQACLRNGCRSVTPIRYALKYVEGFRANLQAFIEELLDALLYQPYRGIMLRELDRFFAQEEAGSIDFLKLLASAVQDQAFPLDQVPTATSRGRPVRSMLSFNFKHRNARHVELCDCSYSTEVDDEGKKLAKYCKTPDEHFRNATRTPWMKRFVHFGSRPARRIEDEKKGAVGGEYNNLLGCVYDDDEPVAEVIVQLLGARSRSADILLSHALLNGNTSLVEFLLQQGVACTLDHLKVALKFHDHVPKQLFKHIEAGAPFKSSSSLELALNAAGGSASSPNDQAAQDQAVGAGSSDTSYVSSQINQWITHLIALMTPEDQQAFAHAKPASVVPTHTPSVGFTLPDLVRGLQARLAKLDKGGISGGAPDQAAAGSLKALWSKQAKGKGKAPVKHA